MHRIGIIGGSGLYNLEGLTHQEWVTVRTPFGKPSDQLLHGALGNREVVFLPRHGRGHRILPSELNHRANIYALKKRNVSWIISVSAVGSLQARHRPRDIVLVDQFVDHTKKSHEHTFFGQGIVAHIAFADPTCGELRAILSRVARRKGIRVHSGGTYLNMEGPAFSTRAESVTHHELGYDVVGMTNLGEARCAREAEIAFATMAMVTDYDSWKAGEESVSVELVVQNLVRNTETAKKVIADAIAEIPVTPSCSCHTSLDSAIMTPETQWPKKTARKLAAILSRRAQRRISS